MAPAALHAADGSVPRATPPGRHHPATADKLAAQVARHIEAEVLGQGWPVGRSLGSEPELRHQYGVSRSVLREAVRLLEHHHVARMRRGPNGGLIVIAPDAAPAARALVIYLEDLGASLTDLMEARRALEPAAAALAAEHINEDGIALLRRTVQAEPSTRKQGDRPALEALHVVLAELSGNPVLHLFIDVLVRLTGRCAAPAATSAERAAEGRRWHGEIADALIAGDGGLAGTRQAQHLAAVQRRLTESSQTGPATRPGSVRRAAELDPGAKLGEVTADRIRADIASRGRPVGTVIGSETELLARYGVSRAVLREAVRLLEHHSVARMRRGPGGGLVVSRPAAHASVATMALYLQYRGADPSDLVAVRNAVELGAVADLAGRSGDDSAARHVQQILQGDAAAPFHSALVEAAGNPVLSALLRILTDLWQRAQEVAGGVEDRVEGDRPSEASARGHRAIVAAVLAGDEGLAGHRTRRHLTSLTGWCA